ncbi:MAG: RidA family protein [Parvibaculales bacterium]
MIKNLEEKVKKLGLSLPEANAPIANYLPYNAHPPLLYVSGQLSTICGKLDKELSIEQGQEAAKEAVLHVLAQAHKAELEVTKCIRLAGYINASERFTEHAQVMNGASDIMAELLGKHARAAFGVASLPLGAAIEIEAQFEIRGA